MIQAGSTARVMVTGQYGAFQGIGAQNAITQQINNDGNSVTNWTENDPTLVSQLLDGNFLSTPYQVTVDLVLGQNYNSPADIANEVGASFGQALGTLPTASACTQIDGQSTGYNQATNSYGLGQLTTQAGQVLDTATNKIETILIVAAVGIVLILVFAPSSVKSIAGAV
jgi:hypothetical protein